MVDFNLIKLIVSVGHKIFIHGCKCWTFVLSTWQCRAYVMYLLGSVGLM